MDGFLLIDKPKGWSSFDVVAKIRGIIKQATGIKKPKVGHTGTLDPLATGLLIIVVGDYCKRAQEFSKLDKTYEVTMRLGQTSTTGDAEGKKIDVSDKKPPETLVKTTIAGFVGEIEQTPPAHSAIKVDGQRAYKLARAGKEVKLEARSVTIYSIELNTYIYPEVSFTAHVSSGTYIRSLVEDIGNELATGAYMSDLRRTTIGRWSVDESILVNKLSIDHIDKHLKNI